MYVLTHLLILLTFLGCNSSPKNASPLSSTNNKKEVPIEVTGASLLIENAHIFPVSSEEIENGYIYVENGLIKEVKAGKPPASLKAKRRYDAKGKYVTPGIIDTHSHLGVYSSPAVKAHADGNEMVKPETPEVRAEDAFWSGDPDIWRAIAGGVTTMQVLPGSGNIVGGRSFTVHMDLKPEAKAMRFPNAPGGVKMACGENPKRVYGDKGGPMTRMGNAAHFRSLFERAKDYGKKLDEWNENKKGDKPTRDFQLETISMVLKGQLLAHIHCYRNDDLNIIMDISEEYGFNVKSFHHGLEAYKVADRLAKKDISVSTWADWWGFKMEAYDGIPENAAILYKKGVRPIIHSDSAKDIRWLNIETSKAQRAAKALRVEVSDTEALRWITENAAWALGIDKYTGTLEEGKMADIVVWQGHPLSSTSRAEKTYVSGKIIFDRTNGLFPLSDFETGQRFYGLAQGKSAGSKAVKEATLRRKTASIPASDKTPILIKNATIWFGDGNEAKGDIYISDKKINKVAQSIEPTKNTRVIDATGMIVTPGLFLADSFLGLSEVEISETSVDADNHIVEMSPELRAYDSFNSLSTRLAITRSEGVLTALSSPRGSFIYGRGVGFDLAYGPHIVNKESALWIGVDPHSIKSSGGSRSMVWAKLRQSFIDLKFFMQNERAVASGNARELSISYPKLVALKAFVNSDDPLVIEANRLSDIKNVLEFKAFLNKLGFKKTIIISGGSESWLYADKLAAAKIPVMFTPTNQTPLSFDTIQSRDDLGAVLEKAGVETIIVPTRDFSPRLRQEAAIAVSYGMSEQAALSSITTTPARYFSLGKQTSLNEGQFANLVIWESSPLNLRKAPTMMIIKGKYTGLDNRQKTLAKKYLN